MPSKPAIVRQSDVTRIMRGAKAAGISMGIVVVGPEVRFVPVDQIETGNGQSALEAWKAKRDADRARGDS